MAISDYKHLKMGRGAPRPGIWDKPELGNYFRNLALESFDLLLEGGYPFYYSPGSIIPQAAPT